MFDKILVNKKRKELFIKYIILFILQLTILELFEAIDFEGKFEKLSYFDHLYLAMEGGTYSFVESWKLYGICSAGSRPWQLRLRPKAPQQIKNFPTKKRSHLP